MEERGKEMNDLIAAAKMEKNQTDQRRQQQDVEHSEMQSVVTMVKTTGNKNSDNLQL